MLNQFIETLSWGITTATSALIISIMFDFDKYALRNVVIGAFIFGCIRGYNDKM